MFNIEDNRKYYLYERSRGTSTEFDNIELLILYFQNHTYEDKWYAKHRWNRILDNYGVTFNDTSVEYRYVRREGENLGVDVVKVVHLKEYVVYDSNGKFINMFNYKNQIFDSNYHEYLKHKYKRKPIYIRRYGRFGYDHPYTFRYDPVPHIRAWRRRKVHAPRHINYFKQIQEYPEYERKKYKNSFRNLFYDYWDYGDWRNSSIKCWKNQSKKKRQWM